MKNNYLVIGTRKLPILFLLIFFVGIFQNTKALNPSFEVKVSEEKSAKEKSSKNNNIKISSKEVKDFYEVNSSKKNIFTSQNTKLKTKRKKISFRKKLSILKLVLKTKRHKKDKHRTKKRANWNGQHTAGLFSWASILVAVMTFVTGSIITGILFSCVALLAFLLASSSKQMSNSTKIIIWIFIGLLLALFFAFEFPLLTEFILYLL